MAEEVEEPEAAEDAPAEEAPAEDAAEEAPSDEEPEAEEVEATTWWEDFRDFYFAIDRRTLGATRLFLGFYLIFDLLRRTRDWYDMYSNEGVLPAHYNLWRPSSSGVSIFNAFPSHYELVGLWLLGMAIYLALFVGYKTKAAQILAAIYVASMNGRVLLIENGGYVVQNLLLLWTAFLPLGDRFSVDALLASLKSRREGSVDDLNNRAEDTAAFRLEPHVSIIGLIILLQLSAIYAFNVIHKTGRAWHDGTAVHYVLYVDRMVNPIIAYSREYLPAFVLIFLTKMVMGFEAGLPVALLSPLARVWARRLALIFVNVLHIGFGSSFVLGPFAWALCVFSTVLLSREDWELFFRTMRREHRARTLRFDPHSGKAFFWARILRRLDRFELLTFEADPKARGLEVTTPDGKRRSGAEARADILSALPAGPLLGEPLRLPGLAQLGGLVAAGLDALVGLFFSGEREDSPGRIDAEYREDREGDRVDAYYMHAWLSEYYGGSFARFSAYVALVLVGGFLAIYGGPMLDRFELDANAAVTGSLTRGQLSFWSGVVCLVVGLFLALKPFAIMNWQAPSSLTRKLVRVRSVGREMLAFLFLCGAVNQALTELWVARPLKAPQPFPIRELSHKMRYLQGWFMFSPNPVMDDGTIIVDAITVDGRRVDPFSIEFPDYTLRAPDYDLLHAKSYEYNQIWSDYFNRMHMSSNTAFRKPMKEYMFRLPERTGNPDDAIVKGVVYWLHDQNPRFGKTDSYGFEAQELFKFDNPDPEVRKRYQELTGGQDPPEIPFPGRAGS
ncbi:MAG: hypothetical protein R3B72_21530 [Polyangiaceae bacterium]